MSVDSAMLIAPQGPIQPAMFPADTSGALSTRVANYVTTAAAMPAIAALSDDTQKDSATIAYALYLAYNAVVLRMAAEPLKVNIQDQGSREFVLQQLNEFRQQRNQAYADYQAFTTVPEVASGTARESMSTRTVVRW